MPNHGYDPRAPVLLARHRRSGGAHVRYRRVTGVHRAEGLAGPTRRYLLTVALLAGTSSLPILAAIGNGSATVADGTPPADASTFIPPAAGWPLPVVPLSPTAQPVVEPGPAGTGARSRRTGWRPYLVPPAVVPDSSGPSGTEPGRLPPPVGGPGPNEPGVPGSPSGPAEPPSPDPSASPLPSASPGPAPSPGSSTGPVPPAPSPTPSRSPGATAAPTGTAGPPTAPAPTPAPGTPTPAPGTPDATASAGPTATPEPTSHPVTPAPTPVSEPSPPPTTAPR